MHLYQKAWVEAGEMFSDRYLKIRSLAFSEIGTSGGKVKVSFQFITFLYVSWGVSEQKGGYPVIKKELGAFTSQNSESKIILLNTIL